MPISLDGAAAEGTGIPKNVIQPAEEHPPRSRDQ
jgi:hypothetical protein